MYEFNKEQAKEFWDKINLNGLNYNFFQSYDNSQIQYNKGQNIRFIYDLNRQKQILLSSLCVENDKEVKIPFGPIIYQGVSDEQLLQYLLEIKKMYNKKLIFCLDNNYIEEYQKITRDLELVWEFSTIMIELPNSIEETFKNFNENRRRVIKKCLENSSFFTIINDKNRIYDFYKLFVKRMNETNGPKDLTVKDLINFICQENTNLFTCYNDDKILSGMITMNFGNVLINRYNCFDSEYAKLNPGAYLEYNLIKKAVDDPIIKYYDMSGLATGDSLSLKEENINRYKNSYGAKKVLRYKWYKM